MRLEYRANHQRIFARRGDAGPGDQLAVVEKHGFDIRGIFKLEPCGLRRRKYLRIIYMAGERQQLDVTAQHQVTGVRLDLDVVGAEPDIDTTTLGQHAGFGITRVLAEPPVRNSGDKDVPTVGVPSRLCR